MAGWGATSGSVRPSACCWQLTGRRCTRPRVSSAASIRHEATRETPMPPRRSAWSSRRSNATRWHCSNSRCSAPSPSRFLLTSTTSLSPRTGCTGAAIIPTAKTTRSTRRSSPGRAACSVGCSIRSRSNGFATASSRCLPTRMPSRRRNCSTGSPSRSWQRWMRPLPAITPCESRRSEACDAVCNASMFRGFRRWPSPPATSRLTPSRLRQRNCGRWRAGSVHCWRRTT